MFNLFKKKSTENIQAEFRQIITLQLNDKCGPIQRGQLYREPLDDFLVSKNIGEVDGGGTQLAENGERAYSDLEIIIDNDSNFIIEEFKLAVEQIGIPKGSFLIIKDKEEICVGNLEGVGVYFRYMEAPEKLFDEINMDHFWDDIDEAVKPYGKYHDYWEGKEKAAFYYYGIDANMIINAVKEKMVGHPFENYIDPVVLPLSIT